MYIIDLGVFKKHKELCGGGGWRGCGQDVLYGRRIKEKKIKDFFLPQCMVYVREASMGF